MTMPVVLPNTLLERTTAYFSVRLEDDLGQGLALAVLETLTLTYYDPGTNQIVNGRDKQDALNANGISVIEVPGPPRITTVSLELVPADTVILVPSKVVETRVMLWEWTWNTGLRRGAYSVQFGIENMAHVP